MPAGTASGTPSVGASGRAGRSGPGSNVRQRRTGASSSNKSSASKPASVLSGPDNSMWKFYTEDSPGIKVGPVPVLIMSLAFIASVFVLHIWGKFSRSRAE